MLYSITKTELIYPAVPLKALSLIANAPASPIREEASAKQVLNRIQIRILNKIGDFILSPIDSPSGKK